MSRGRLLTSKKRAADEQAASPAEKGPWGEVAAEGPVIAVNSKALGLKLVHAEPASVPVVQASAGVSAELEKRMQECMNLHDFSGALQLAENILQAAPGQAGATVVRDECRRALQAMHWSRLGNAASVPTVKLPPDEIIWLGLDHRAGFVLSQVDGTSSYEDIVEVSGMERTECLRILVQLAQAGAIGVGDAAKRHG